MSHLQKARDLRTAREANSNRLYEKNEINERSLHRPRVRLTPTHCLGPRVCSVVGVCGRMTCIAPYEVLDWMDAVGSARSPENPHRIPEFDPVDIESEAA